MTPPRFCDSELTWACEAVLQWADSLRAALPPGSHEFRLAASMAVLAAAFVLLATPPRAALSRWALFAVAALSTLAALIAGLQLLPESLASKLLLTPLLASTGIYLLAKCALTLRFAALREARAFGRPDSTLLPNQQSAYENVLEKARLNPTPAVIGLEAGWGSGKSMVVEHLLYGMEQSRRGGPLPHFVAVKVNVWEYESLGDMQWGVMQALLAHPLVLRRFGWLDYPVWMLAREWGRLRLGRFAFDVAGQKAEGDGELRLPWQAQMERVVGRLRRRGLRVTVVLDEIDRADAHSTQCALTLLHRSLSLPGVVALVPFVPEIIRFKAFHPSMIALSDIRGTAMAWLEDRLVQQRLKKAGLSGEDVVPAALQAATTEAPFIHEISLRFLQQANRWEWVDYYRHMEEKYLRLRAVIPPLRATDIAEFVLLPDIAADFNRFPKDSADTLAQWIREDETRIKRLTRQRELPLRSLKGSMMQLMSARPFDSGIDPRFVLALAIRMADQDGGG